MLTSQNGTLKRASEAREKSILSSLKEEVDLKVMEYQIDNYSIPGSVVINKLKNDGVLLNDGKTFAKNENYSLLPNGNIIYSGETVENVKLTSNVSSVEAKPGGTISNKYFAEDMFCKITGNDCKVEFFSDENYIKLEANSAPEGMKFEFFMDKYNNIFFNVEKKKMGVIDENEYYAIYVPKNDDVNIQNTIAVYSTNKCKENYLEFMSSFVSGKSYTKAHVGILATKNKELANVENLIVETNSDEIYYRGGDVDGNEYDGFTYFWTKGNVGNDTWYCRGYATITYQDGTTETIYTDIISEQRE